MINPPQRMQFHNLCDRMPLNIAQISYKEYYVIKGTIWCVRDVSEKCHHSTLYESYQSILSRAINESWLFTPNWKCICINFQCGGPAPRCIYSSPKIPADDHIDRYKIKKCPHTTVHMDKETYYTATQVIWTCGLWLHALRTFTGRANEVLLLI